LKEVIPTKATTSRVNEAKPMVVEAIKNIVAKRTLANPVHVVLTGTLVTGDIPFPSSYRSVESKPSQLVGMDEALKPTEKNGLTITDVSPEKVTFTMFLWRPPQPVEEIDTMQPALIYEVPRQA
jgi:hypothetical protein